MTAADGLGNVAVLCDIHGNAPALDAVLVELESTPPDAVVIGGDIAAGPMPVEVLERIRSLPWPVHWLRGNADRALVMCFDDTVPAALRGHPLHESDAWTARLLSRADRDFLDALPPLLRLPVAGLGEVLFCHGTPRSDEERVTVFTPEARLAEVLAGAGADVVVAGHTHRQLYRRTGRVRLINAGSVGRPYEADPGAYWLRLGRGAELRRTPYDTAAATRLFQALGYPTAGSKLAPVDPDAVAARYEEASAGPLDPASLIPGATTFHMASERSREE